MNNIFKGILGLMIFLLALIFILGALAPLDAATGYTHSEFESMNHSGVSVSTNKTIRILAYLLGMAVIGVFSSVIFSGARKKDQALRKKVFRFIALGTCLYLIMFSVMVFSYWYYNDQALNSSILGYPIPTTWMLYGLGFAPIIFVLTYILKFDTLVFTKEEEAKFKAIIEKRKTDGRK